MVPLAAAGSPSSGFFIKEYMEIKDLKEFAAKQSEILGQNNLSGYDKEKRILHAAVKANEEMGELCDVVLKSIGSQRKEKSIDYKKEQIGEEISDVFFTVSILAHLLDVDVETALKNKMKVINSRYDNGKERTYEL
jgi:NTP pyrophosphatase (non-canonical NTP hydrolase)